MYSINGSSGHLQTSATQLLLRITILLMVLASSLAPRSWASVGAEELHLAVKNTVMEELKSVDTPGNLEVEVGHLDSRMKLNDCSHPLHINTDKNASNKAHWSVKVACAAPSPWSIYVPVTVHHYRPVVTTTMPLQRGKIITDSDIALTKLDVYAMNKGYFTQFAQVLGHSTSRALPEGTLLNPNNIRQADIIKKGDGVMIKAAVGSVFVQTSGTALQNGAIGEQIEVENNQSKQVVKGTITGKGLVEVVL